MTDSGAIPSGRFNRLRKLAGLGARVGVAISSGASDRAASQVFSTLGEMRGLAMKTGQMLSMLGDRLPPDARVQLSRLLSAAPAMPYARIAEVVTAELGGTPGEVFRRFEEQPFAAASLGQVHLAETHAGDVVAVKVQYPGIAQTLKQDLDNLGLLVGPLSLGARDAHAFLGEVRGELLLEIDYRHERAALERYTVAVAEWPDLLVPKAFPQLSTDRVLTMERLEGPTLLAFCADANATPERKRAVAASLIRAIWGPMLQHGIVHADPHPGNFLVQDTRLAVLDFGCVKELSPRFVAALRELLDGALAGGVIDTDTILRSAGFFFSKDPKRAQAIADDLGHAFVSPARGVYRPGADDSVERLADWKQHHPLEAMKLRLPPEAVLFMRTITGLSHNLRKLDVEVDLRPVFQSLRSNP